MHIHQHKWRGALALLWAALALFVFSAASAQALSIRVSLADLGERSQAIVRGRVERIESAYAADGQIESTVYVRVGRAVRGLLVAGSTLPVRISGGTVDGLSMGSSEEAHFTVGEDVFLFLAREEGAHRVAAGKQGKFGVVGDRAVNQAWGLAFPLEALSAGAQSGSWPRGVPANPVEAGSSATGAAVLPDAYVYNNVRWPGSNPMEEPFEINLNTADAGGGNGSQNDFINAIVGAANTWGSAGAKFRFRYQGTTGVAGQANDNHNVVYWENLGNSTTLAEAKWWYMSNGTIVDADIRFNDYYAWDVTGRPASNEPDLQSVAAHELGHWLSLGHDNEGNCSHPSGPMMCATYQMGSLKRSLHANDVAGIRAIYGAASVPPTATPRPTATPTPRPTLAPWQIKSRSYLPLLLKR
jgi:hypothetical protein